MQDYFRNNRLSIVAAFFAVWAIQLTSGITVRNPLTVVLFALLIFFDKYITDKKNREVICSFGKKDIVKISVSIIAGVTLTYLFKGRVTGNFDNLLFKLLAIIILLAGFFGLFCILTGVNKYKKNSEKSANDGILQETCKEKLSDKKNKGNWIFINAFICFLCWLPYFLYEFPGIMTADSLVQYEQVIGNAPYSNHHPLIHTLLIKFFYYLGLKITNDPVSAISFYTAFQMIFMALCCAVLIGHIKGKKRKIAALLFFALIPFNAVFVVTIWKDIIFAGLGMLLICITVDLREKYLQKEVESPDKGRFFLWCQFVLCSILFMLFRSNALYGFIIWLPFLIYAFKGEIKAVIISVVIILAAVFAIKGPVMEYYGVVQPDFVESLSVPVQQIAAIIVSGADISNEDRELIEKVIDTTYIRELYAPDFADNIKELIRAGHPEVLENNKAVYLGLWIREVLRHPIISVKAWYDLVGGYIYPDFSYEVGNIDGIMNNTFGLYWKPLIAGKIIIKVKEILIKLGSFVPLYGMLWSIGTYTWLLIISLFVSIKKNKSVLCKILLMSIIFTLLIAAPVVDFRYGYLLVMTMPLWALVK